MSTTDLDTNISQEAQEVEQTASASTPGAAASSATPASKTQSRKAAAKRSHMDTRELVTIAIFAAMVIVLSFIQIPLMPAAPWLSYDPSGVISLIASLLFGPVAGVIVSVVGWFPRVFFSPWGTLLTIICISMMSLITGLIYSRKKTLPMALVGMVVGAVVFIALALVLNLIITPLYTAVSVSDVVAMIVPILLPFNLIKCALNIALTALLYKPVSNLVKRRDGRSHI